MLALIVWLVGFSLLILKWLRKSIPDSLERIIWRLWKRLLHVISGKNELQRVCDGGFNSEMAHAFHSSLKQSNNTALKGLNLDLDNDVEEEEEEEKQIIVDTVCDAKSIKSSSSVRNVQLCVDSMYALSKFKRSILADQTTAYDSSNTNHEAMLENLWNLLSPGVVRDGGRISNDWQMIGFQGTDPATDFRGMGILGLKQMVYASEIHTDWAQNAAKQSDIDGGFPFAIVSISITDFLVKSLKKGLLDALLYRNMTSVDFDGGTGMKMLFNELYFVIYRRFRVVWQRASPENVLAFPPLFSAFCEQIEANFDNLRS